MQTQEQQTTPHSSKANKLFLYTTSAQAKRSTRVRWPKSKPLSPLSSLRGSEPSTVRHAPGTTIRMLDETAQKKHMRSLLKSSIEYFSKPSTPTSSPPLPQADDIGPLARKLSQPSVKSVPTTVAPKKDTTRDVSYILDQLNVVCRRKKKSKESQEKQSLLSTISSGLGFQSAEAAPYPQSLTELRDQTSNLQIESFRQILSRRIPKNLVKGRQPLLKTDIFKGIPDEFYQSQPKPSGTHKGASCTIDIPEEECEKKGSELGIPSSRSDAMALLNWFNAIMRKLNSESSLCPLDKFQLAQAVYYIGYREVSRQVTVHCYERGFLMWKIWRAYLALFAQMQEHWKAKVQHKVDKKDLLIKKIREDHEKLVADFRRELPKARIENDQKKRELEKVKSELQSVKLSQQIERETLGEQKTLLTQKLIDIGDLKEKNARLSGEVLKLSDSLTTARNENERLIKVVYATERRPLRPDTDESVQATADTSNFSANCSPFDLSVSESTQTDGKHSSLTVRKNSGAAATRKKSGNRVTVVPSKSTMLLHVDTTPNTRRKSGIPPMRRTSFQPQTPGAKFSDHQEESPREDSSAVLKSARASADLDNTGLLTPANHESEEKPGETSVVERIDLSKLEGEARPSGDVGTEAMMAEGAAKEGEEKSRAQICLSEEQMQQLHSQLGHSATMPGSLEALKAGAKTAAATAAAAAAATATAEEKEEEEKRKRLAGDRAEIKQDASKAQPVATDTLLGLKLDVPIPATSQLGEHEETAGRSNSSNTKSKDAGTVPGPGTVRTANPTPPPEASSSGIDVDSNLSSALRPRTQMPSIRVSPAQTNCEGEDEEKDPDRIPLGSINCGPEDDAAGSPADGNRRLPSNAALCKMCPPSPSAGKRTYHYKFAEFKLGRKKELRKKRDNKFIQELKDLVLKQKVKVYPLPRKSILKMISYFYNELLGSLKTADSGYQCLAVYIYSELTNKYGLKNVADRKFMQVCADISHTE